MFREVLSVRFEWYTNKRMSIVSQFIRIVNRNLQTPTDANIISRILCEIVPRDSAFLYSECIFSERYEAVFTLFVIHFGGLPTLFVYFLTVTCFVRVITAVLAHSPAESVEYIAVGLNAVPSALSSSPRSRGP